MIVPGAVLERVLPRGLTPEQRGLEVDLERLVVAPGIDAERGAEVRVGRRVVDQDVQPAEPFDRGRTARSPASSSPALQANTSTSPVISAAAASS